MALGGRECLHSWTPPGASDPAIVINRLRDEGDNPVWPCFKLKEVIRGLATGGDRSDKRIGGDGSIARPDTRGSSVHTYTIEVWGRTVQEMRAGEQQLRDAFADQSAEGRMDVAPHPWNVGLPADYARYFNAKPLDAVPAGDFEVVDTFPKRFYSTWVLGLRNHEGKHYEELTLGAFKQAIIDLGPSLYWPLDADDGATDLSGNGHDGAAQGGLTFGGSAGLSGIPGDDATNFAGSGGKYISSSYAPFVAGGAFTAIGFMNLDAVGPLVGGDANSGVEPVVEIAGPSTRFRFRSNGGSNSDSGDSPLSTGTTYLWAVTIDDTANTMVTWIDQAQRASELSGSISINATPANVGNLSFGKRGSEATLLDGRASHFIFFDRDAQAEVAQIAELVTTGRRSYW